ncbi:HalX domain-containing protein [Natronococcus sp. A-GB7]|uniref:HalX domain-containing protein n=1 Tax=Natronococcus sp. A-GB7 TaxID=3037649 RepID=UPI002420153F|nr:HalX domain-containing protein [Natronococcus sp. A-GB7]MDG5820383.1 HalX domain-containing protein [Natronococcus sp. A-GB7]
MRNERRVLVVDDESQLADLFATWLSSEWTTETAYDGAGALETLDESFDVVLLDRRMPGQSGDEVLERIRENGYDCRVIMVTAVDPDFDIIEMGFDDYLVKPVSKDELLELVESVANRSAYQSAVQDYYALVSKKALLESEKEDSELADNEEYQELCSRIDELEGQLDETVTEFSTHDDFVGAFEDI